MLRQRQHKERPSKGTSEKTPFPQDTASRDPTTDLAAPEGASVSRSTAISMAVDGPGDPRHPLLGTGSRGDKEDTNASLSERHVLPSSSSTIQVESMENLSRKSQWIVLAIASGGCAAFNGVFAKLTTTELTTNFATAIAKALGLSHVEGGVEVVVRGLFFALNLIFNGIMWTLFTKALARGTSTTQVSILNTSSNFMITAVLGFLIFSESLPPMWFVGAALLVAGNVIIGRREEGESKLAVRDEQHRAENGEGRYTTIEEEELLVGDELELESGEELEIERKRREDEDLADLGLDELVDVDSEEERRSPRLI